MWVHGGLLLLAFPGALGTGAGGHEVRTRPGRMWQAVHSAWARAEAGSELEGPPRAPGLAPFCAAERLAASAPSARGAWGLGATPSPCSGMGAAEAVHTAPGMSQAAGQLQQPPAAEDTVWASQVPSQARPCVLPHDLLLLGCGLSARGPATFC